MTAHRLLKHVFIGLGLLVVFSVGVVVWYWPTFATLFQNMGTMGEGADDAQAMRHPDDLLAYIAAHPEHASLVAFDLNAPAAGLAYAPEARRAVTGLPGLLTLAAYTQHVATGRLHAGTRIARTALDVYHLPGTDGGAHRRMMDSLGVDSLRLDQVVTGFTRLNNPVAGDYLLALLGRETLAQQPARLGLPNADPPLPFSGHVLAWHNHAAPPVSEAPPAPEEAYQWAAQLASDEDFRQAQQATFARQGTGLSLDDQRTLAQATFPQGTAAGYARLMVHLAADTTHPTRLMRTYLEQPLPGAAGRFVGSKGGSFPGLISFAGYVRDDAGQGRVVVMLLENLPMAVFYHLLQTGLDKGLAVQLLLDAPPPS